MVVSTGLCRAGTVLAPGSAVFTPGCTVLTPGCTVSLSLPLYPIYAGVYRVGCGLGHGLGRDNHLLARHLLFFSSFRLFLWIFVDVDASAIKLIMIWNRKSIFLIGIRISPGSTGVYRVDVGVCRDLLCRHRGLPCWHRGVPGSAVFTPGWRRGLPCWHCVNVGVCRVGTVLTPGLPCSRRGDGLRGDRRRDCFPGGYTGVYRALPRSRRGLPCLVWL